MSLCLRHGARAVRAAAHPLAVPLRVFARASLFVAATFAIAACMSDPSLAPGSGAPSYAPAGSAPPALAAASERLDIGTWQWVITEGPGTASVKAAAPEHYTLKFEGGGRVLVRADCNRGSASYEVNGNAMTFKPIAVTRMGCPAGTQDAQFIQALSRTTAYGMRGDELALALSDGATMRFRHVP